MRERDYRPALEHIKNTLTFLAPLVATGFLAFSAFDTPTRKEIGARDRWTCQCPGCTRDFRSGYMVTAAHYPHKHQYTGRGYHDDNPSNGRILCQIHHALEEIDRGNLKGATLLLNNGIFTHEHADSNGGNIFLSVKDLQDYSEEELLEMTRIKEPVHQLAFQYK